MPANRNGRIYPAHVFQAALKNMQAATKRPTGMFKGGETVRHRTYRVWHSDRTTELRGLVLGECPHGVLVSWSYGTWQSRCCDPEELEVIGLLDLMAEAVAGKKELRFSHRPPTDRFADPGYTCPCVA